MCTPGSLPYQEARQAMLFGARVLLSLNMRSDPAFGANIDPQYTRWGKHRDTTTTTIHVIYVNMMLTFIKKIDSGPMGP